VVSLHVLFNKLTRTVTLVGITKESISALHNSGTIYHWIMNRSE